jgi:hypothetical protein
MGAVCQNAANNIPVKMGTDQANLISAIGQELGEGTTHNAGAQYNDFCQFAPL